MLTKMGYRLYDNGNHWRSTAIYRNGKNPNSLLIFKETGVWVDYGLDDEYRNFADLIKKTLGEESSLYKAVKKNNKEAAEEDEDIFEEKFAQIPTMKKVYPKDYFVLLPHYSFYLKKGISEKTLKDYGSGLAMSKDSMANRYVFPVWDENEDIIGFNGRTIIQDDYRPKWKILGGKKNFCYPAYIKDEDGNCPVIKSIQEKSEVFLVESIGDSLFLYEKGHKNNLVTFGLSISSNLIAFLNRFSDLTIYICPNNDFHKEDNNGKKSAIKSYLDLSRNFDYDRIKICLPEQVNDFGEMAGNESAYQAWLQKKERAANYNFRQAVIKEAEFLLQKGNAKQGGIPLRYKKDIKNLKID